MTVGKKVNGDDMVIAVKGRLDTITAPELEQEINGSIEGIKSLVFDLKDLEYISSAGLRVLLASQKIMNKQGEMMVINVNPSIMEIFEVTGFSDILTIS